MIESIDCQISECSILMRCDITSCQAQEMYKTGKTELLGMNSAVEAGNALFPGTQHLKTGMRIFKHF